MYYQIDKYEYINTTLRTCAQLLSYDTTFECYFEGVEHKKYVELLAKHLKNYCKDYYNLSPEGIDAANRVAAYKKFITSNKNIFDEVVALFIPHDLNPDLAIDVRGMLRRMINLASGLTFSKKLYNIADCGFAELTPFSPLFNSDVEYTEAYVNRVRAEYLCVKKLFDEQALWLDDFRETIVAQMQEIIEAKSLNENEIVPTVLDPPTITRLAYCELLFVQYCGACTYNIAVTKSYCRGKTVKVPEL